MKQPKNFIERITKNRKVLANGRVFLLEAHAMVIATSKIGDVPEGSIGSVVHVYDKGKAYEVEFIINGSSFVETAMGNQIKLK